MSCSSKGPGLFSDFDKLAKGVLSKDYSDDQKLLVSSQSDTGLVLGSTLVKKGGLSYGDVAVQYKLRNATVDLRFDTESNISTTLSVADIIPSSKTIVACKLPDYSSAKIEAHYFHEHASLTAAVGLNKSHVIDLSATVGTPSFAFGSESSYVISSGNFLKYNAGVTLRTPNGCASVILFDKGDAVKASYLQHIDKLKKGVAVGEISRKFSTNESTLTVGGSFAIDPHTMVKAKLNNHGHLGTLVQHELKAKSILTVSGTFDTLALEKTPRFGVALSLKP